VEGTNLGMVSDTNGGDWAFMLDPLVWFRVLKSIQDCERRKKKLWNEVNGDMNVEKEV